MILKSEIPNHLLVILGVLESPLNWTDNENLIESSELTIYLLMYVDFRSYLSTFPQIFEDAFYHAGSGYLLP